MLVTLFGVAFYRQPDLPLKPTTLAATLCYLSHSTIPEKLNDISTLKEGLRNRMVRDMDLKYGMWVQGCVPTIEVEASVNQM